MGIGGGDALPILIINIMTEIEKQNIKLTVGIDVNLLAYKGDPEKLKAAIDALEPLINQERKILFSATDAKRVKDLKTLVVGLFYGFWATIYADNKTSHCSGNRRRSLIDFYMLQKEYLVNPLDIHECADIYFNKLFRFEPTRFASHFGSRYNATQLESAKDSYVFYYCSTVKRNVLVKLDGIDTPAYDNMLHELDKINRPIKTTPIIEKIKSVIEKV